MFKSAIKKRTRLNRAQQREVRTAQILEAAWIVFCEKGYESATMEGVAEQAGISRMPINSLFGDKQNLYYELSRTFVTELKQTMLGVIRPNVSLRRNLEQLARLVSTHSDAGHGAESLFYVVQVIALSRPDIAEKLRRGADEIIKDFADAIRASRLDPGDRLRATPEIIASHVVAHLNGLSTVEFQTRRHIVKAGDLVALFNGIAFRPRKA
ncbi:TetR/AcrR family transcriptional regulator [Solimonas terrae]|uniref:TetR/AcrR family transcriptional regulator n=1 Tax=Solimonas terrae TaxID=1396819 RepID=A0A6M2BUH5_9GAMM|nr:TetR/AcrR family transcriptional regulator [Solimonas terrae]NGY05577.1 TetR/AcrR family transcriptional regulator [Solimonas terrae]